MNTYKVKIKTYCIEWNLDFHNVKQERYTQSHSMDFFKDNLIDFIKGEYISWGTDAAFYLSMMLVCYVLGEKLADVNLGYTENGWKYLL